MINHAHYTEQKEFTALQGGTELHKLTFNDYVFRVALYLETEEGLQNINAVDDLGNTSLHIAAIKNHTKIFSILFGKGAKLDIKNKEGHTPLDLAVREENMDIFKTLSNYLKFAALKGGTKLHILAFFNYIKEAQSLLETHEGQQDINKGDEVGNTPLHIAAEKNHIAMVALLLENGADPCAKNRDGYTPIDLAVLEEHNIITKKLLSAAPNFIQISNRCVEILLNAAISAKSEYGAQDSNEYAASGYAGDMDSDSQVDVLKEYLNTDSPNP